MSYRASPDATRDEWIKATETSPVPTTKKLRALLIAEVELCAKLQAEGEAARAAWSDPDSPERQALTEEIILSLDEGSRSEIDLREAQLDATEAALAASRAECDVLKAQLVETTQNNQTLRLALEMERQQVDRLQRAALGKQEANDG